MDFYTHLYAKPAQTAVAQDEQPKEDEPKQDEKKLSAAQLVAMRKKAGLPMGKKTPKAEDEEPYSPKNPKPGKYGLSHEDGSPCDAKTPDSCPHNKKARKVEEAKQDADMLDKNKKEDWHEDYLKMNRTAHEKHGVKLLPENAERERLAKKLEEDLNKAKPKNNIPDQMYGSSGAAVNALEKFMEKIDSGAKTTSNTSASYLATLFAKRRDEYQARIDKAKSEGHKVKKEDIAHLEILKKSAERYAKKAESEAKEKKTK